MNPEPTEPSGIDLYEVLHILRKRFWIILLVAAAVVSLTYYQVSRQPKLYFATATIEIDPRPPKVLGRAVEDVVTLGTGGFHTEQDYYETQYKIIQSRDVAERVVLEHRLNEDPSFLGVPPEARPAFKPVPVMDAVGQVQGKVSVSPVKDSWLVEVTVSDLDPVMAQQLCNWVTEAYIRQNLERMVESSSSALGWLLTQMDGLKSELDRSENGIASFKKEHGILALAPEDGRNVITNEMSSISSNMAQVRAKRIAIQARRDQIRSVLKDEDPLAVPIESVTEVPLVQRLKESYVALQAEEGKLKERYLEKHPRLMEIQAQKARLEESIRREVRQAASSLDVEYEVYRKNEEGLEAALRSLSDQAQNMDQKEMTLNRLNRERENIEELYQMILKRAKETDLARMLNANNIRVLESATRPESPTVMNLRRNLLLALLVGLLLGTGLVLVLEFLDRTVKNPEQLERLGIQLLGIVPNISIGEDFPVRSVNGARRKRGLIHHYRADRDLVIHHYPKSTIAERCRAIRTNILFTSRDNPARRILVTSPSPKEGKTTVAVCLAVTMAQSGSQVLIVDGDMRMPRLHRTFRHEGDAGLSDVLFKKKTLEAVIQPTEVKNLFLLPCGKLPPNPADLIHSREFVEFFEKVSTMFDKIIFDSPPIGMVTDPAILSQLVDATILVFKPRSTRYDMARFAVTTLNDIQARILGVVFNDIDATDRMYKRYYADYYRHYGKVAEEEQPRVRTL